MNEEMRRVSEFAKKLVAAGLFLLLLTGGAATVLSVLAAGLNTMSTKPSVSVGQMTNAGSQTSRTQTGSQNGLQPGGSVGSGNSQGQGSVGGTQGTIPGSQSGSANGSSSKSGTGLTQAGQSQDVTMTSPVGQALDRGGVVVGQHVQQAFGNVLSSMIRILFIERPERYAKSSSSVSSSGN
jgi:hypothetical protein